MGFGSGAIPEETKPTNVWSEVPEYHEVKAAYVAVGKLKAQSELLSIEIEEIERGVKRGSRKANTVDEAKEASKHKRLELARVKAELHEATAYLDWLNFRRDVLKTVSFANK